MSALPRGWLRPSRPGTPAAVEDPRERRAIKLELIIVFTVTLGYSAAFSLLSFVESLLREARLADQQVALHRPQASIEAIDLLKQLLGALKLIGFAALGVYLLWRAGIALGKVGLSRRVRGKDIGAGALLAAVIGIPGLVLYLISWQLGFSLAVVPSLLEESWWRPITLTLSAIGNAVAEEVLIVGYLLTRLRQLGIGENASLLVSSVLRGSYHLYQGAAGFFGNLVMGLIFGRVWQRTHRLWPLIIAHALLDVVAFVGYSLVSPLVSWLP
ncbi:MAG: CPBP family intramembrane metalloprotease [Actinophytocola sp.]|nr:CPBP family intramembrane metalloprotease [Actinophytocola sp.]